VKRILVCSLLLLPAFALAQEYLDQFPHRQQTEYFDLRYRRNSPRTAEIARFADGFIKIVNRDFFKADFDYPIRVLVLEDRATFKEFLRRKFHDNDPPDFGIYLPGQNARFMSSITASQSTLPPAGCGPASCWFRSTWFNGIGSW
jgi:hypothetical protein